MFRYNLIESQFRMIWDKIRCSAYCSAVQRAIKPNDVVIDYGCGFAIWSMVAAKAGAARVYAIDSCPDVARIAEALIAENGLTSKITVIYGDAGSVELPEQAGCIISEIMNGSGFNEYDGTSLMRIRDRFLKPQGIMIPQRIQHVIRPADVRNALAFEDGDWANDWYGLSFRAAQPFTAACQMIMKIGDYEWAAEPRVWWDLDLRSDGLADNQRRVGVPAEWLFRKDAKVNGIVAYFVASLDGQLTLSTAPDAPRTHWRHTFLPFPRALSLQAGDALQVTLRYATAYGSETYPMEVVWTRQRRVMDKFETYPSTMPLANRRLAFEESTVSRCCWICASSAATSAATASTSASASRCPEGS